MLMLLPLTISCSSNRMVLLFWCWLTQVLLDNRPLNECTEDHLGFIKLICILFLSDQVSNLSRRDGISDIEEFEPVISDNIVSSTYLSMLRNRLKLSVCIMNGIGPSSNRCSMPPFKKRRSTDAEQCYFS